MQSAAYYVSGRIVVARSHMMALEHLSEQEKDDPNLVSGRYDPATNEFVADLERDHFYDKEMLLVRHGRASDFDDSDPDISDEGLGQVLRSAYLLSEMDLDGFVGFASPLLRCLRTASLLHGLLGIKFQIVPTLIETPTHLKEDEVFKLRSRATDFSQFSWPTSREWHVYPESNCDFLERVRATLQEFPSKCIVVTHYGFICNLARLALCEEKARCLIEQGVPPASITYINRETARRLGQTDAEILQDRPTHSF